MSGKRVTLGDVHVILSTTHLYVGLMQFTSTNTVKTLNELICVCSIAAESLT